MLEEIIRLDHQLFQAINTGLGNAFFDWLMPIMRNKYTWIPLYIGIIFFAIKAYKVKGLYFVIFLAATVGIADFGSASIIKPIFKRDRPCNEVAFQPVVLSRVPCGSGKSFPSTHASDHFSIAIFLVVIFRKKWKYITAIAIFWAAIICFAQVYVGVHFPIDVMVGALFGSAIGYLVAKIFLKYVPFKA
ncbi:phosphatase PAP2 family protein [Pedobacter arcticus]|uniref:phosphatase PAP2 family protein n=1 Tax=Pedobacter arcticus TaxID=752140 RepID=UPI00030B395F|nr:phosphatase PAP2 family protein [Pedobacter arcticus]